MAANDLSVRIKDLVNQRIALENRLQNEHGQLADSASRKYDDSYATLQRQLASLFRDAGDDAARITIMLEMMRILENRLVYLQNFTVDPSSDNRILAQLVTKFIDQLSHDRSTVLTLLEAIYYRAVAALYAGDLDKARQGFREACASEESDEANDIKYKSYVILGNLSHEERDYVKARELADQSLRYSHNDNVTAQASLQYKVVRAAASALRSAATAAPTSFSRPTCRASACSLSAYSADWRATVAARLSSSSRRAASSSSTVWREASTVARASLIAMRSALIWRAISSSAFARLPRSSARRRSCS